ncbi:MAG: glycine--tRNA ligase [Minisyncoccia bacterium]
MSDLMDKIVSLCKRRGFIFPDSEIYGGIANTWDFGPLGVELKNNIKKDWWKNIVLERSNVVGLDSAIIINPKVWEASGHVTGFTDPLVECKSCHTRFRADDLFNGKYGEVSMKDGYPHCPLCGGELTEEKKFNLMFKTFLGPVEDSSHLAYLRPETAQGIFINFKQILNTSRQKIPFGIAQIGKSFRNEITPGNFIFRTREFEQMELEYFVKPSEDKKWYQYWQEERMKWYQSLGLDMNHLRLREHSKEELAHYAKNCADVEYQFPFLNGEGWGELEGIANRTDFDLRNHLEYSGQDLKYFDESTKETYLPYIIEPSAGVERSLLAFLLDAYHEEQDKNGETRIVLKLHPRLSPIKLAIFPLLKNNPELVKMAQDIYQNLQKKFDFLIDYDEVGSIGRRYRRQDEIGTPWGITIDHQSLEDKTVTLRDRDTMQQERIKIEEIEVFVLEKLSKS